MPRPPAPAAQDYVEIQNLYAYYNLVSDAGDAVRVAGTNGGIRFSGPVRGDIDLTATNGSIRIAVPAQSRFEIDAESRHGGVFSSLPVREAPRPGEGPLPKVRARTVNGGIHIDELR